MSVAPSSSSADSNSQEERDAGRKSGRKRRRFDWRVISLVVLAAVSLPAWRLLSTSAGAHSGQKPEAAPQPVSVAKVVREDLFNQVTYPAEFRPYREVELHAKVSGYVDQINVDIGDQVKEGQLLATLEVPESRNELARAKAAEKRAGADYKEAHLVYTRLLAVEKDHPSLVAQQELDAAQAKDEMTEAALAAATAETEKDQTLLSYTRITAPFDGVITHRYADPGSLIQAGTSSDTQSKPLVRLSDNYRLRLDFPVSVAYVKDIRLRDPVEVRVESLNDKTFTGLISRFSQKVDDATRTMITEIEVSNPDLQLIPGMYATLVLTVQRRPQALTVPSDAILTGARPEVYLVDSNLLAERHPVSIGLETPSKVEVTSGLKEGDTVIVGGFSKIAPGQKVEPKRLSPLAQQ